MSIGGSTSFLGNFANNDGGKKHTKLEYMTIQAEYWQHRGLAGLPKVAIPMVQHCCFAGLLIACNSVDRVSDVTLGMSLLLLESII